MSEPLLTLSYQHKTEPDVRFQRVLLGCAILAMDAALLLMFRYVVGPMLGSVGAAGLPQRFATAMFTVGVYTLMSLCVPIATALLAGSKMPRVQAGRVVGRGMRHAAIAIACVYVVARLLSGTLRISVLYTQSGGAWPSQGDWRTLFAFFFETVSAPTLLLLQFAAWIYFADLAARLRRGAYMTLATLAFGLSAIVMTVIFLGKIEQMAGGWYPPDVRTFFGWLGSDVTLCVVHLAFWSIAAGLLQGEPGRLQGRG